MKKVLSVILAIMMVATFTPMAFAEGECKHAYDVHAIMREGYTNCENCGVRSADFTECFKSYVKLMGKAYSIGNSKIDNETLLNRFFSDAQKMDISKLHRATETDQVYVDNVTKEVNEYIEALNDEFTVVYDATDLMAAIYRVESLDLKDVDVEMYPQELLDKTTTAADEYLRAVRGISEGHNVELEECIENGKTATYYYVSVLSCLDGNHQCTAYTDLGNGSHSTDCTFCNTKNIISAHEWGEYVKSEDGSKIAGCKYCDATDTDDFEKNIIDLFRTFINLIKSLIEAIIA